VPDGAGRAERRRQTSTWADKVEGKPCFVEFNRRRSKLARAARLLPIHPDSPGADDSLVGELAFNGDPAVDNSGPR